MRALNAASHRTISCFRCQTSTVHWNLELRLRQHGETTELTFVHHLTDPTSAGNVGPGWEYYLDRWVAARAGAALPDFGEYYPSQKAHYEEEVAANADVS